MSKFVTHLDVAAGLANRLDQVTLVTLRRCMCCNAYFHSTGRGNRLCQPCRKAA